jgi:hypothetical protein
MCLKIPSRLSSGRIEITRHFSQSNWDPGDDSNVLSDTRTRFDLTSVPFHTPYILKIMTPNGLRAASVRRNRWWRIARQRLGKHARNIHVANNTAEEVFSMWSAPRLLGNWVVTRLYNNRKHVFSTGSVPRLYNESLFVALSYYRTHHFLKAFLSQHSQHDRVRVRVTLWLVVYRQSVRLGAKPLYTHDQHFFGGWGNWTLTVIMSM